MERSRESTLENTFDNPAANASRFRGNFLIEGAPAFAEDHWRKICIGTLVFEASGYLVYYNTLTVSICRVKVIGPCRRCHMVCIDQKTADKNPEPYATLAECRRLQVSGASTGYAYSLMITTRERYYLASIFDMFPPCHRHLIVYT
jgi:uncharacterized protein YcbX